METHAPLFSLHLCIVKLILLDQGPITLLHLQMFYFMLLYFLHLVIVHPNMPNDNTYEIQRNTMRDISK